MSELRSGGYRLNGDGTEVALKMIHQMEKVVGDVTYSMTSLGVNEPSPWVESVLGLVGVQQADPFSSYNSPVWGVFQSLLLALCLGVQIPPFPLLGYGCVHCSNPLDEAARRATTRRVPLDHLVVSGRMRLPSHHRLERDGCSFAP